MPLIKTDELPVTRDELAAIRERLVQPFQHELVVRDERRYLFVRSPRDEPDPVSDLEACFERVPDWAIMDLNDVFLLGRRGSFHVPGRTAQPLADRRVRFDQATVRHLRETLDAQYGWTLHRVAGDILNLVRAGLRVPRERMADIDESDLVRIARALGPLLSTGEAANVQVAYLIADQDHLRLQGTELFGDVAPRWESIQRDAPTLPETPPEPVAAPPPVPKAPRRRPQRVINVRPIVDIETTLDATPTDVADGSALRAAEQTLEALLRAKEFDVLAHVAHDNLRFALAAERPNGYPRRVLVHTCDVLERATADAMVRAVRSLDADLILVVAREAREGAVRKTLATKVKVIRPDEVSAVSL